jgi:hypothetical protein
MNKEKLQKIDSASDVCVTKVKTFLYCFWLMVIEAD